MENWLLGEAPEPFFESKGCSIHPIYFLPIGGMSSDLRPFYQWTSHVGTGLSLAELRDLEHGTTVIERLLPHIGKAQQTVVIRRIEIPDFFAESDGPPIHVFVLVLYGYLPDGPPPDPSR